MRKEDEGNPTELFSDEPDLELAPVSSPNASALLERGKPTWQLVLFLAWPVLVQQLLLMAVGLYDQYLAGNNPPADPSLHVPYQAAQTTANYLAWFLSSCSAVISVGSMALVARFTGAEENRRAVHAANQSIFLAIVFGLASTIVGLLFARDVVGLMRMSGPAGDMTVDFLVPILSLVTFQMIESAGLACFVGRGDTRPTLWVLGGIALINMPLAWICFHGLGPIPSFGFQGIALGTGLSHAVGGIAILILLRAAGLD